MSPSVDEHGGDSTDRRQFLTTVASGVAIASVSGCLGILPSDTTDPTYPGGTVVIENAGERSLDVSISVGEAGGKSFETTVAGGETHVRREFVVAEPGDVVTLAARLGDGGDPTTFDFLPAGGEDNTRPEIARLTVQNAVEGSADWTAERGAR